MKIYDHLESYFETKKESILTEFCLQLTDNSDDLRSMKYDIKKISRNRTGKDGDFFLNLHLEYKRQEQVKSDPKRYSPIHSRFNQFINSLEITNPSFWKRLAELSNYTSSFSLDFIDKLSGPNRFEYEIEFVSKFFYGIETPEFPIESESTNE